jgi:hypothetical protein
MGRARRGDVGGMIYHALTRANFRSRLFRETANLSRPLQVAAGRVRPSLSGSWLAMWKGTPGWRTGGPHFRATVIGGFEIEDEGRRAPLCPTQAVPG